MNEDKASSTTSPIGKRLVKAVCYGASAGLLFSSPGVDQTLLKDFSPILLLQGLAGMLVLFGLPAGVLLGFLDNRRGNKSGWRAVIIVPAMIVGGFMLFWGILAIPITIGILAHSGSEWLAGGADNALLRQVIGVLAGSCFGLILLAILIANESIKSKWCGSDSSKQKADNL
jgi:uncharacterized membrane protein